MQEKNKLFGASFEQSKRIIKKDILTEEGTQIGSFSSMSFWDRASLLLFLLANIITYGVGVHWPDSLRESTKSVEVISESTGAQIGEVRFYLRPIIIDKYSSNYAKNIWSRFKACLGYAERLGYIDRVPFKGLDNPRGTHHDTKFWIFDEFKKVINSFDISEYEGLHNYMTIWLYFMTGLTVSEDIALKQEDIDFERKWIHVHSTIEKDKNGVWYAKQQTKTVAGNRKIDLDDFTITILKKWREVQIKNDDKDYVI